MIMWKKSSRSTATNSCVEVASDLGAMRDSKNPTGPVLEVNRDRLASFLAGVKAGRLNN